jgi:hypothetical protein
MCNSAEYAFERLLNHASIKSVEFNSLTLIKIAKQHPIGEFRIAAALPFIKKEYGYSFRKPDGKYVTKLRWQDVPAKVVLDYIFGLDFICNWRGYHIGVDVTANPEAVCDKQIKLQAMKPLWRAIGIDQCSIFLVEIPEDRLAEMRVDALVSSLRKVAKSNNNSIEAIALGL